MGILSKEMKTYIHEYLQKDVYNIIQNIQKLEITQVSTN